jgi:hypothetical protein
VTVSLVPGEIIQHGVNGLLVNPGDEKDLASAIELLILNPELRRKLAQEAFKVREKYNFDKIAREYLDFITTRNIIISACFITNKLYKKLRQYRQNCRRNRPKGD